MTLLSLAGNVFIISVIVFLYTCSVLFRENFNRKSDTVVTLRHWVGNTSISLTNNIIFFKLGLNASVASIWDFATRIRDKAWRSSKNQSNGKSVSVHKLLINHNSWNGQEGQSHYCQSISKFIGDKAEISAMVAFVINP